MQPRADSISLSWENGVDMLQNEHTPRKTTLTSCDLFALHILRGATFSADASHIAISTSHIENVEKLEIWIIDRDGGQKQRVPFDGNASSPVWSPDGTTI